MDIICPFFHVISLWIFRSYPLRIRAPLGHFCNAPHCGGGGYFELISDLRNYWTDSKN